jgi:hypothetical protein
MDKARLFIIITAIISFISFNFNKILDIVLSFISDKIYDTSVFIYGPYMKSIPITIEYAIIDEYIYTNKTMLLLNWKWSFDILGFTTSDILLLKPDASIMILQYSKKYGLDKQMHTICIDFKNNIVSENGITKDIMFEEICLFGKF